MRIDVQCHVFPPEYSEFLIRHSVFPTAVMQDEILVLDYGGKQKFSIARSTYDPAQILRTMDKSGIDISLISCNIPDVCLLPSEYMAQAARLINQSIQSTCQKFPDRFVGLASIPWCCSDAADDELRWAARNGFKGAMLYSRAGDFMVDDVRLIPLYQLCADLDLVLVIHPTIPSWYEAAGAYDLVPMLSFQMDSSLALMRLILSGTIEKNPRLRVVMPHAGGVLPYMDGRIRHQTEILKRGVGQIQVKVTDQLRFGQIWYDTVSPSVESLRFLENYVTADRIIFGTDFPFISTEYFVDLLGNCGFSKVALESIFWKNANKVFKLGL